MSKTEKISLFGRPKELWFHDLKEKEIGTIEDTDGWTYYPQQAQSLHESLQWIKNGQATTSVNDVYELHQGIYEQNDS